jgi:hypothetical protein
MVAGHDNTNNENSKMDFPIGRPVGPGFGDRAGAEIPSVPFLVSPHSPPEHFKRPSSLPVGATQCDARRAGQAWPRRKARDSVGELVIKQLAGLSRGRGSGFPDTNQVSRDGMIAPSHFTWLVQGIVVFSIKQPPKQPLKP